MSRCTKQVRVEKPSGLGLSNDRLRQSDSQDPKIPRQIGEATRGATANSHVIVGRLNFDPIRWRRRSPLPMRNGGCCIVSNPPAYQPIRRDGISVTSSRAGTLSIRRDCLL